jgi:hypothetical protein
MKSIRPMKNLILILLLLQWGIAPCAGACGKVTCPAGMPVNHTISPPVAHACQACAEAKGSELVRPKLSDTGSCCHGAPSQPPILSPRLVTDPGPAFHSAAATSAQEGVYAMAADPSTISHSGQPPPSRVPRAIYQTLCDLRI